MKKMIAALSAACTLALAGCATTDGYNNGYGYGNNGYYGTSSPRYDSGTYRRTQPWSAADEGRRFSDGSQVICRNVQVANNTRDPDRVGGTVAGAVIGGLIGNQIGDGNGRTAATAAGAIAGGAIGRNIQGRNQEARGQRHIERRCERVWY